MSKRLNKPNGRKSKLIVVAGGSGSGKTTLAQKLARQLGRAMCAVLSLDNFYCDNSHLTQRQRERLNFDEPDRIDIKLLLDVVGRLLRGKTVRIPVYDFKTHTRLPPNRWKTIRPHPIIILEGILALHWKEIRELADFTLFVDTPDDYRLARRAIRDIKFRGRTLEGVLKQWFTTVRPMHHLYVQPSATRADLIVPFGGGNRRVHDLLEAALLAICRKLRLSPAK